MQLSSKSNNCSLAKTSCACSEKMTPPAEFVDCLYSFREGETKEGHWVLTVNILLLFQTFVCSWALIIWPCNLPWGDSFCRPRKIRTGIATYVAMKKA